MTWSPIAALRMSAIMLCLVPAVSAADDLKIAVASNFRVAMEPLVAEFEAGSEHDVIVSYGSTGKHYAQLVNGAPYDVFLAADKERPGRLEDSGIGVEGSRFTYALGTLVLWGRNPDIRVENEKAFKTSQSRFLAIANPRTAPYGLAAEQFLKGVDLWASLQSRIVRGENVSQAYAFVRAGNADMGLIALSLAMHQPDDGSWYWHDDDESNHDALPHDPSWGFICKGKNPIF